MHLFYLHFHGVGTAKPFCGAPNKPDYDYDYDCVCCAMSKLIFSQKSSGLRQAQLRHGRVLEPPAGRLEWRSLIGCY